MNILLALLSLNPLSASWNLLKIAWRYPQHRVVETVIGRHWESSLPAGGGWYEVAGTDEYQRVVREAKA